MKRDSICFSASRETSITSLSCADTQEESDQETDESSDDGIYDNSNKSTSSSLNNYADNATIQTKGPRIFQISDYMLPKRIINHLNAAGALNESDGRVLFAGIFDKCINFT